MKGRLEYLSTVRSRLIVLLMLILPLGFIDGTLRAAQESKAATANETVTGTIDSVFIDALNPNDISLRLVEDPTVNYRLTMQDALRWGLVEQAGFMVQLRETKGWRVKLVYTLRRGERHLTLLERIQRKGPAPVKAVAQGKGTKATLPATQALQSPTRASAAVTTPSPATGSDRPTIPTILVEYMPDDQRATVETSAQESKIYFIRESFGAPTGDFYVCLATKEAQAGFLAQIKSATGVPSFARIKSRIQTALARELKAAGLPQGDREVKTVRVRLRLMTGPWARALDPPFVRERRHGVLFAPEVTTESSGGTERRLECGTERRLEMDAVITPNQWASITEVIDRFAKFVVSCLLEKKAPSALEAGCDAGSAADCVELADAYILGRGVTKDLAKGVALLQAGCQGGSPLACSNLGSLYSTGVGVPADKVEAFELYQRACDGGHALGCFNLASCYARGQGVLADPLKALDLSQRACANGVAEACYAIGTVYEQGNGVAQDIAKAIPFYERACGWGVADACYAVGALYYQGRGTARDMQKAFGSYQKGCELGSPDCCYNVGVFHKQKGNRTLAGQAYKKGCDGGHGESCRALKELGR